MIRIQSEPFDPFDESAHFAAGQSHAGALATFVGTVRNGASGDAAGAEVASLTLEHYPGFTEKEIEKIEDEARRRFDVIDTLVIHRYGRMEPGEAIVMVCALSKHRREALDAIDYLMDRLKTDAPFWKKEERAAGDEWIEPRSDDRDARARWDEG
jgi:molybdopterin synthase catalytic subunit